MGLGMEVWLLISTENKKEGDVFAITVITNGKGCLRSSRVETSESALFLVAAARAR